MNNKIESWSISQSFQSLQYSTKSNINLIYNVSALGVIAYVWMSMCMCTIVQKDLHPRTQNCSFSVAEVCKSHNMDSVLDLGQIIREEITELS